MIEYALLTLSIVLLAWKLSDLARDVRDPAAWSVVVTCGAMAGVVLFAKPFVVAWAAEVLWPDAGVLLRNLLLVVSFAALQSFYLLHVAPVRSLRRWWVEVVGAVAVMVVATVSASLVPLGASLSKRPEHLDSVAVLVFFLTVSGYLCHACATQVYWTVRSFRWLRRRSLRLSTLLIGVGCLLLLSLQVPQFVQFAAVALTDAPLGTDLTTLPPLLATRLGVGMLLAGLILPVVVEDGARLVTAVRQVHEYRRLAALDRAIIAAFPELVRPAQPGRGPAGASSLRSSPVRVGFVYHDRLQRCRDGYTRALPFVSGAAAADAPELRALVGLLHRCPGPVPGQRQTGEREHLLAVADVIRKHGRALA